MFHRVASAAPVLTVKQNNRCFAGTLNCGSVLSLASWWISTEPANFSRTLSRGDLIETRSPLVKRNFEILRKSHNFAPCRLTSTPALGGLSCVPYSSRGGQLLTTSPASGFGTDWLWGGSRSCSTHFSSLSKAAR